MNEWNGIKLIYYDTKKMCLEEDENNGTFGTWAL